MNVYVYRTHVRIYVLLLSLLPVSLWPVRFISITQEPVYFAVYYRKGSKAIRYGAPQEKYYTVVPGGKKFISGTGYTHLPFTDFDWPKQVCESSWSHNPFESDCHPRTVFFSFEQSDMFPDSLDFAASAGKSTTYLGRDIGSALYHGWNVDAGETHLIFYNPFGFDPRYAAYGTRDSDTVVRAGKLNSAQADVPRANSLRRYLLFTHYQYFGK